MSQILTVYAQASEGNEPFIVRCERDDLRAVLHDIILADHPDGAEVLHGYVASGDCPSIESAVLLCLGMDGADIDGHDFVAGPLVSQFDDDATVVIIAEPPLRSIIGCWTGKPVDPA